MKSGGALAWRSRTKDWRTSSLAGARGRLWSPRSIRGRRPSVRHNDGCNVCRHWAATPESGLVIRRRRRRGPDRAEVAGRRGSPPRADSGSALARNWRSRDAARVPQAGHRPAGGARSRGGQAARILGRRRDWSAGRNDPQANRTESRRRRARTGSTARDSRAAALAGDGWRGMCRR
jgi:hypothetical protein